MELTGHVTEDVLIAYFCGELPPERMQKIDQHVLNCPVCRHEFQIFKALFAGFRGLVSREDERLGVKELQHALRENLRKNKIYYTIIRPDNFAPVLIARTHRGVVAVLMGDHSHFEFEERLKKEFPRLWIVESNVETEGARQQMAEYFRGDRRVFDLAIDERLLRSAFQKQVLWETAQIPYGHFTSYGDIARRIGNARATRAVGRALGQNPLPIILPCHRVIAGGARLGGFTGGVELKVQLLQLEGVASLSSPEQLDFFAPPE